MDLPDLYSGDLGWTYITVAGVAVAFWVLEVVIKVLSKPILLRLLQGHVTEKKADGIATQAVARIVGSIHNTIQVPVALLAMLDPLINGNRVYGRNPMTQLMCLISAGYFLHDLVMCLLRYDLEGPAYTIHALCCHASYFYGAYSGFIHFHGAAFLMWELSTPFVHLRWLLYKLKKDHTRLYFINGLLMVLMFFLARIVWGYYASYLLVSDVLHERYVPGAAFPYGGTVAYCVAAVVMNTLNTWWFYKMAERAGQVVFGGKKAHEVGREKDE